MSVSGAGSSGSARSRSGQSRASSVGRRRGRNRDPPAPPSPWRARASRSRRSARLLRSFGGDDRLALADHDAQADVEALRAFELLDPCRGAARATAPRPRTARRRPHRRPARRARAMRSPSSASASVSCAMGRSFARPAVAAYGSACRRRQAPAVSRSSARSACPSRADRGSAISPSRRRSMSSLMRSLRPQVRVVSPGHLSVASSPILPPSPATGEAKSR